MTYTDLENQPASYNISTESYGDFESHCALSAYARQSHRLRLDLCQALGLDPDTTTDELLVAAAGKGRK